MKRVLIVEDDVSQCLALSDLLCEFGFETGVAGDGEKALEILDQADPLPDVILLDLHMPNMDGFELRKKLQEHPWYSKIPIIVMTGDTTAVVPSAVPKLTKPLGVEEVVKTLVQALKQ